MRQPGNQHGFSLVELMVAIVIGMMVVGSALAIFLSNRQTYGATEGVGRTQENGRMAFELMSRDLREAGSTPCGNSRNTVSSVVNGSSWWNWGNAIGGYDGSDAIPGVAFGTAAGNRVAGTDAVEVHLATSTGSKVESHNATANTFLLVNPDHGFRAGEIVVACDYMRGAVFQISSVTAPRTIGYATGGTPGNSTTRLGGCMETDCTPGQYTFQPNGAVLTRLGASRWFIGVGSGGVGRSLYLQTVQSGVGALPQEVATGVTDMQITYLLNTNANYWQDRRVVPAANYVASVGADEWSRVLAARIVLTLTGPERVNGNNIVRTITHNVSLRNQNT